MSTVRSVAAAIVCCLAFAACGGGGGEGDGGDTPTPSVVAERPTSAARLSVERPTDGQRVRGDRTRLVMRLQGAELTDRTSTDLRPDQGHLHVTLDGVLVSMTPGLSFELTDLTPGEHLVQVEFVANDHAPFDPRVVTAVSFEATG